MSEREQEAKDPVPGSSGLGKYLLNFAFLPVGGEGIGLGTQGVCSCRAEVGSFQLGKGQAAPWEHQAAFTLGAGVRLTVCWYVQCPTRALLARNVHFHATWPRKSLAIHVLTQGLCPQWLPQQEPEGRQKGLRLARKPSRGRRPLFHKLLPCREAMGVRSLIPHTHFWPLVVPASVIHGAQKTTCFQPQFSC